jgi:chorismate mutase
LRLAGITKIVAVHRGFSTERKSIYRNDPIWRIPIELRRRMPEIPFLCDPSHMAGSSELIKTLAQEAMDHLYDGLMIEVHPHPENALSDGAQQITPAQLRSLMASLKTKKENTRAEEYLSHIDALRKEIDGLDRQLLDGLSRRMEIVRDISRQKERYGVSFFQPRRWRTIVEDRTRYGVAKKLDPDFVLRLFEGIHEEALRWQEQAIEAPPPESAARPKRRPKTG